MVKGFTDITDFILTIDGQALSQIAFTVSDVVQCGDHTPQWLRDFVANQGGNDDGYAQEYQRNQRYPNHTGIRIGFHLLALFSQSGFNVINVKAGA